MELTAPTCCWEPWRTMGCSSSGLDCTTGLPWASCPCAGDVPAPKADCEPARTKTCASGTGICGKVGCEPWRTKAGDWKAPGDIAEAAADAGLGTGGDAAPGEAADGEPAMKDDAPADTVLCMRQGLASTELRAFGALRICPMEASWPVTWWAGEATTVGLLDIIKGLPGTGPCIWGDNMC